LQASISEEQQLEYGRLVEENCKPNRGRTLRPDSGIRYPQNGWLSCSHLGLCLSDTRLVDARLIRKAGANDFDWIDELVD